MDLVLEPSYRKLWRLMRERHLKKKDLQFLTGLSPSVITKLGRNETVHLETLLKICSALKKLYQAFNTDNATMMAVFFDSSTSADITMDAIREIRAIAGKQCHFSGISDEMDGQVKFIYRTEEIGQ